MEAGGYETDGGGGDLGGGVVGSYAFSCAGGWVEEREVVGHSRPHACYDYAEKKSDEAGRISNVVVFVGSMLLTINSTLLAWQPCMSR